jgi:hypothetical protein
MGMVIYPCNLSILETKQEGHEFRASLGYRARPCLKYIKCKRKIKSLRMY